MNDGRTLAVFLLTLSVSLSVSSAAEDGQLKVRVIDSSGDLIPVRAWVDAAGKRLFAPTMPETATPYAKDRSFSCDGAFTMVVPTGPAVVHVEKGKEFMPIDIEVKIPPSSIVEKTIELKRWINMPSKGWYSADLHVHFGHDNPRVLRQLALADDVHLIPSFTYWLRGEGETWKAEWPGSDFGQPITIDSQHLITRNNIEIERIRRTAAPGATIGATFLFNLNQPVTAPLYGFHFPTDAQLCRVVRRQSPNCVFDSDKPSWAETVVGAALGQLDTIQVCHNHYHRLRSIPGGYGMIGPLEVGESNADVGDGLFHRTNALYYRFLNCGFRLGVSGGSAIGVMALPAGYNRTYAKVDGEFTAKKMWASIKAGRTFATSGPILSLIADRAEIGSTLSVDSSNPQPIRINTRVQSVETVEALQLIHNGIVVATLDLLKKSPTLPINEELDFDLVPKRSGWIAARALYRAPDGLLRQAHTSPIYLSVDNEPTAFAGDARYMIRWIDRLVEIADSQPDRFPTAEVKNQVLATYAEARARYEVIIESASSQ